jgi:hypothetical protein
MPGAQPSRARRARTERVEAKVICSSQHGPASAERVAHFFGALKTAVRCEWRAKRRAARQQTHYVVAQKAGSPDGSVDTHRLAPRDVAAVNHVRHSDRARRRAREPASWRCKCEPVRERRQLSEAHDADVLPQRYLVEQLLASCIFRALAA